MIDIVYKGFLVGVLVSAPMGPIGMLVIRRTLNKGFLHGLVTGLGAVLSDVIYASVTSLAIGVVINFIESNHILLQLFGSAVLALFGIYIYRSNPTRSLRKQTETKVSLTQDFVSAFFLTFSNVLIVFLYIALFARFEFVRSGYSFWIILGGIAAVAVGAVVWWLIITYVVSRLRKWFNIRGLWLMNRIVGGIIIAVSVIGFITALVPNAAAALNVIHTKTIQAHQMKTLNVPYLPDLDEGDATSLPARMETAARREYIQTANWPEAFPYKPVAVFDIARSDRCLYIRFFVKGNSLKAVYDRDGSPVYQDSCVEFFMQREGSGEYINFEFNCIGACDASRRKSRLESTPFTAEEYRRISRYPTLEKVPFGERQGVYAWELTVGIPFTLMGLDPAHLPEKIRGNFYKCADGTSFPHYLSWSPVGTSDPDFHRPEFFGEIRL